MVVHFKSAVGDILIHFSVSQSIFMVGESIFHSALPTFNLCITFTLFEHIPWSLHTHSQSWLLCYAVKNEYVHWHSFSTSSMYSINSIYCYCLYTRGQLKPTQPRTWACVCFGFSSFVHFCFSFLHKRAGYCGYCSSHFICAVPTYACVCKAG